VPPEGQQELGQQDLGRQLWLRGKGTRHKHVVGDRNALLVVLGFCEQGIGHKYMLAGQRDIGSEEVVYRRLGWPQVGEVDRDAGQLSRDATIPRDLQLVPPTQIFGDWRSSNIEGFWAGPLEVQKVGTLDSA